MNRRQFLRHYGIASSAITFSPFFIERFARICQAAQSLVRVYKVKNGDCFQNIAQLWEMLDGPAKYIGPNDIVVIKGNAQWPNQGYTHTGCIKGVIDAILAIPRFAGEVLICDNVQAYGVSGAIGFDATPDNRNCNWPDQNWDSLAASYSALGQPVGTVRWTNDPNWRTPPGSLPCFSQWNPANGNGWSRYFLSYNGTPTYLSSAVFQSPLTPGRMIDVRNGVWENGQYTGRQVKVITMPTLNNHGTGSNEDCGVSSAIKSFFGATEIPGGVTGTMDNGAYYTIHSAGGDPIDPEEVGELVGTYINNMFAPRLYITCAIWSGWYDRTTTATETDTVLACANPVTLDYVSARDVISPYASWLDPDQNTPTRQQILACNDMGIGTIDPTQFEVITYDFNNPTASRLDVERKIRDFKAGIASETDVKNTIELYMESNGD